METFESLRSDYRAGKDSRFHSRLTGVNPGGSGADYHYRIETQYLHMMERARHYQREDQVVGQAIRRLVNTIVQNGFTLDPRTGDKGLDGELKARWEEWAEDPDKCHSEGELSFHEIEKLALSSSIVDGDVFFLLLEDGSIQPVEAHRVRTPRNTSRNVVMGVHLDERARRLEYWITKEDIDPRESLNLVAEIEKYEARDADNHRHVLHLYEHSRFSQRRGVTAMAPISETIGMHDDLQFATLVKQQMGALIALLRERPLGMPPRPPGRLGPQTTEEDNGFTRTIEGMSAGIEVSSAPGEKLSAFSPTIPGPGYFDHTNLLLTFIAVNLDMPVHMLLLDASNTNFSGHRGAMDMARSRFRGKQRWMKQRLHRPVYEWKVRQWIVADPQMRSVSERSDVKVFRHEFNPPSWPYLEPMTDAGADLLMMRNGLDSPTRIFSRRGLDYETVMHESARDKLLAYRIYRDAARMANAEAEDDSERVNWMQLASIAMPDGVNVSVATAGFDSITDGKQPPQQKRRTVEE